MNRVRKSKLGISLMLVLLMVLIMTAAVTASRTSRVYAEEDVFDNHWKLLTLIYTDVQTETYQKSFTDAEVNDITSICANLPDVFKRLSGGRFMLDRMDFEVIREPVTSTSGYNGFSYGPGKDIDFDSYLEGKDYDFVYVFAPLSDLPEVDWYGLGGMTYNYNGRRMYYAISSQFITWLGAAEQKVYGDYYDSRVAVMVHEMLHCIETNSRYNGITDFTEIHDAEENGYEAPGHDEWLTWYHDAMQDKIKTGAKGFSEESFYIHHPKRTYPKSISMAKSSMNVKTGQTFQLSASVLPEDADYQNLVFRSSDPYAATVTSDGKVTTRTAGKVVITVSPNNSTIEAKCTLNITGSDKLPVVTTDDGKLKLTKNRNGSYTIVGATKKAPKYLYLESWFEVDGEPVDVTKIAPYAFKKNKKIKEICIQDSKIKTIGKGAFYGMPYLTCLDLDTTITKIPSYMCKGCKRLKYVYMYGKIKSVGSKAFTGIKKKPKVYVGKKTSKKIKKKIKKQIKYKVRTI